MTEAIPVVEKKECVDKRAKTEAANARKRAKTVDAKYPHFIQLTPAGRIEYFNMQRCCVSAGQLALAPNDPMATIARCIVATLGELALQFDHIQYLDEEGAPMDFSVGNAIRNFTLHPKDS